MTSQPKSSEFLDRIQKLSPKRLALLAAELERRLTMREATAVEPIAVIGQGCRMPGDANTADALWELLSKGVDAIEEIPPSRWDASAFYDPRSGAGKTNTKWGGFTRNIDQFDAAFFGISPREAVGMDPQQRMLLEVSWEALENACVRAELLNGSLTGVFVGMSTNDYTSFVSALDQTLLDAYSSSGVAHSVAAGRLSHFLGLKGPNLVVDTACSSSAVALHLACQSLRQKECSLALAGGVNAILSPQVSITLSQAQMMAGDGRCKTFSQSADGFVRSEGCCIFVLKRLSEAQADGDRILGVIRGSAINHDGRSSGLTAPNGPSQEAVIRAALAQAGLDPERVDYIEAHGTGTVLGDAVELGALGAVFGAKRDTGEDMLIGSVKTNIGHMEAAAGAAGVLKVLLALEHETLPAHLHVTEGNKNEALKWLPLQIPLSAKPWPATSRPRVAGVSSFGFGGTNAHIVIEEAPSAHLESGGSSVAEILTISAKDKRALSDLCGAHAEYLRRRPNISLADVAFTLNSGRSHFQHRVALLAGSVQEAADQLQQIAVRNLEDEPAYRFISDYDEPSIGFLFTGQGSQQAGMGRALYSDAFVFRSAVDECDRILKGKLAYRLSDVLCGEASVPPDLIHDTEWTQPALFTFEYALAMLWRSWGVRPSIALGHSLGEYVAACIAGVFSLEQGLTLAFERGRLMGGLPRSGAMLAVLAGEEQLSEIIRTLNKVSIAAVNGPRSVVISGVAEQVEEARNLLTARGVTWQPLTVSHAFHSEMMEPILDEFESLAARVTYAQPEIPLVSNVSGKVHTLSERIDASYWRRHIRSAVRFSQGFSSLMEQRPAALLEVGPDPVLLGMAKPALAESSIPRIPSLLRGKDTWKSLYAALREMYLLGVAIDWNQVYRDRTALKLALPTYAFQRQRYWITTPERTAPADAAPSSSSFSSSLTFDSMLYTTEWRTEQEPIEAGPSLTPEQLLEAATKTIDATGANREKRQAIAAFDDFIPRLDRLCATYILESLRQLGADLRKGARVSRPDFSAKFGVRPEHTRLMERLFAILEEDGIVRLVGDSWVIDKIPTGKLSQEHADLIVSFPQFAGELNFLAQAAQLPEVLRGRLSPLEVLFPNGSFDLVEQVYRESLMAQIFNLAVGEVVSKAVNAYPPGRIVKVVEVGAGTGSTTSQILPLLDGKRVDYLFTDVSPAFCGVARNKFASFPFVRYASLDLEGEKEGDPAGAEGADIVVAANVLHATADLVRTLSRIRRMLRPGGTLVILEATAAQRFADLTFGMTEGWWRYKDFRECYPLIGSRQWLALLSECGFRSCSLGEEGPLKTLTQRETILVAQAHQATEHRSPQHLMLVGGDAGSKALASALQAAGMVIQKLGEPADHSPGGESAVPDSLGHHTELSEERLRDENKPSSVLFELAELHGDREIPERTLDQATEVLQLLQTVIRGGSGRDTIWLVTRGAAAVDRQTPVNLPSTIVDAMAKTASLEHPELTIRWVDLPVKPAEEDLARLGSLIHGGTREHSLAIRQGKIVTPRLVSLSAVASRRMERWNFIPDAAYLVTGAYSGLGFRTVQWMVERGAKHIIMIGRREPSLHIRRQIAEWSEAGAQIVDLTGDISERRDVENLFQRIADTGAALRGIIHSAGILEDGILLQQSRRTFASVFASKVRGSWLLHEYSRNSPLDFFVLFGSVVSYLGSAGQCNHAAGNGFLDALSHLRRMQGLPSTTIAWGAWSEIGAAPRVKDTGRAARLGLRALSPEKGIELLEEAICSGHADVAALSVDWQAYLGSGDTSRAWPFFEKLLAPARGGNNSVLHRPVLKGLLEGAPTENRLNIIREYVRGRIAEVLRLESGFVFPENQPFAELGLDSLMALELKNALQTALGVTLPPNFFFEYPNLGAAATFLNARQVIAGQDGRQSDSTEYERLAI